MICAIEYCVVVASAGGSGYDDTIWYDDDPIVDNILDATIPYIYL